MVVSAKGNLHNFLHITDYRMFLGHTHTTILPINPKTGGAMSGINRAGGGFGRRLEKALRGAAAAGWPVSEP